METFIIDQPGTLEEILKKKFENISNRTLKQWIQHKRIWVSEKCATHLQQSVKKASSISIKPKDKLINGIPIVYEDNDILVVLKPAYLLSVDRDKPKEKSLHRILKDYVQPKRIYPVHRLDYEVGGLILFAKTSQARDELKSQFESRLVKRTYLALLEGLLPNKKGVWKYFLSEKANLDVVATADPNRGKYSETHYKVLALGLQTSWVQLTLQTGRKHQIRVHSQMAGYPIVGDKRYGSTSDLFSKKGMALFAKTLSFSHPIHKRALSFQAPLPEFFIRLLRKEKIHPASFLKN